MQKPLSQISTILLYVAAAGLIVIPFTPIWRIDLDAPQYPEGLRLLIYANGLKGNVDIINGLNHYIGMKTLHTEDFFEFRILTPLILFFSISCIITALSGKRVWLYTLFLTFLLFGMVAMVDFWRWEYDYGHNLDPNAAIIVPGMAYQPPLIGFKQLLNFGAYSIPDIGGWIFISIGAILLLLVVYEWNELKKEKKIIKPLKYGFVVPGILSIFLLHGCTTKPEPIVVGMDNCSFCKMTISDKKYSAEYVTDKGKVFKFDDSYCMLSYIKSNDKYVNQQNNIYFTDYTGNNALINSNVVFLLKSKSIKGPMNGNIAAFSSMDSLLKFKTLLGGDMISMKQLQ